jgi:hypothetical protein
MESGYAAANKAGSPERPKIDKATLDQMRGWHARSRHARAKGNGNRKGGTLQGR